MADERPDFRMRMAPEDRERYGGPEWVSWDWDAFRDLEVGELERIEEALDMSVGEFSDEMVRRSSKGRRAALWVARRLTGVSEDYRTFTPKIMRIEFVAPDAPADADPPGDPPVPANRAERRAAARRKPPGTSAGTSSTPTGSGT